MATSAFHRLRTAYAAGDTALIIDLLNAYPVHCWYGGNPVELATIIASLPKEAQQLSFMVRYLVPYFDGQPVDAIAVTAVANKRQTHEPFPMSWDQVMRSKSFRLTGHLKQALKELPNRDVVALAPAHSVNEAVRAALLHLHRGTVFMLNGHFNSAQKELVRVHGMQLPEELQVLRRDALVKSALIEGLYGDIRSGRGHLRIAATVPRTESWLEPQLDAATQLAETVVAERADFAEGLRKVMEYPLQTFGELWPFAVLGSQRVYDQLGRRAEYVTKLQLFVAAAPPHTIGEGLPGSALALAEAMICVQSGDLAMARTHLIQTDPDLVLTKRVHAMLQLVGGAADLALRYALEIRPQTKSLRQFEIWRTSLEVSALLAQGEREDARLMLSVLLSEMNGLNKEERRVFSTEIHDFAEASKISWPEPPENFFSFSIAPALPHVVLSERERQVLNEAVLGRSRAETAQALFLSENTVKTHLSTIYKKLGVVNRAQLIAEARLRAMV